ncbi:MAG: hypothetical protein KatS3mg008_0861 [Acidimicrobiales bacterium]|nr:MAG: hypothetical protein KatS3mg008_0861 [Acidimicrobiales bacterium]
MIGECRILDDKAVCLVERQSPKALSLAVGWAASRSLRQVEVVFEDPRAAATAARRAPLFALDVSVWVRGAGGPIPAEPDPFPAWPEPGADAARVAEELFGWLAAAPSTAGSRAGEVTGGSEGIARTPEAGRRRAEAPRLVADHGCVVLELDGLEVARVLDTDEGARVEVGVGVRDRLLRPVAPMEMKRRLERVAHEVRSKRREGSPHPYSRLSRGAWYRNRCLAEPARIGLRDAEPIPLAEPREVAADLQPAAARGRDDRGNVHVLVFAPGPDPDAVTVAAELRLWLREIGERADRLRILVPSEADLRPLARIVETLREPVDTEVAPRDPHG